jgi:hypothetical protein
MAELVGLAYPTLAGLPIRDWPIKTSGEH